MRSIDSPQSTLIPLAYLAGLPVEVSVRRYDIGVGLHGDHVGGEREAARALLAGTADAAALLDATHLLLTKEGLLPPGGTRIVAQTPPYDHCVMAAVDTAPDELVARFRDLLLGMSYADPYVRPLLDLEGLTAWLPGRIEGYRALAAAVDQQGSMVPAERSPRRAIRSDRASGGAGRAGPGRGRPPTPPTRAAAAATGCAPRCLRPPSGVADAPARMVPRRRTPGGVADQCCRRDRCPGSETGRALARRPPGG